MKLAIIIGVSAYDHQSTLLACKNDAEAIYRLIKESNNYSDICFLADSPRGRPAKDAIRDFIEKHKGSRPDELFFFFSGHGARIDGDFFYVFSDFKEDRRETTGLRNSELDGLLRNLSPKLTVKIVDACNAGGRYIKADEDLGQIVDKSAKLNELSKLYFMHSSGEDEVSWAGSKFSWFTESILGALVDATGTVRFRDIASAVADDMIARGQQPVFVSQADLTEIFLQMTPGLTALVQDLLGRGAPAVPQAGAPATSGKVEGTVVVAPEPITLAKLAEISAKDTYCTEEEAALRLASLEAFTKSEMWPKDLTDAFSIVVQRVTSKEIPNPAAIGRWISSSKIDSLFATLNYDSQKYTVEEYKELPRKPSSSAVDSILGGAWRNLFTNKSEKEYKLEKVEKVRDIISGFRYSVASVFEPTIVRFSPKFPSLENYAFCVCCLFSRRTLSIIYSMEHLRLTDWDSVVEPRAPEWKPLSIPLKDESRIKKGIAEIIAQVSEYVISDATSRLNKAPGT